MLKDKQLHDFLFEMCEDDLYSKKNYRRRRWTRWTPWVDVCVLLTLIKKFKVRKLLEIGTNQGHTTKIITDKFPNLEITTVDPGDKVSLSERLSSQKKEYMSQEKIGCMVNGYKNVEVIKEDFLEIQFNKKFDFIFIDGNHSYNHVVEDTKKALTLIEKNGIITWHDCNHVDDVTKALNQFDFEIITVNNTWVAYAIIQN